MNFRVQSLIQDLENMGLYAHAVSKKEWQDKFAALAELDKDEYSEVNKACLENPSRKKAWDLTLAHDPDPALTERKSAFDGPFQT